MEQELLKPVICRQVGQLDPLPFDAAQAAVIIFFH